MTLKARSATISLLMAAIMAISLSIFPLLLPRALADATECSPVAIVPIRGSGEQKAPEYTNAVGGGTDGWEGAVLQKLLKRFFDENPELGHVPIVSVPGPEYEAKDVNIRAEASSRYLSDSPVYQSANTGITTALQQIGDFRFNDPRGCDSTQFILLGFSQGAMVAREVATLAPRLVYSVFLYGDPWQKANADGVTGSGRGGSGIFRTNYPGAAPSMDRYYEGDFIRRSVCHEADPICDVTNVRGGLWSALNTSEYEAAHYSYFDPSRYLGEAVDEARRIGEHARTLIREASNPTSPPRSPRNDISLVIDTTGSMGPFIGGTRDSAKEIAERVIQQNNGSKVSLVEYRDTDQGDEFATRLTVPATADIDVFTSGVDSLYPAGGGDTPEAVYSGIVEGVRSFEDPNVRRTVIVIGDAPPKDPEPVTGYTGEQISRILAGAEPVPEPMRTDVLRSARSRVQQQGTTTDYARTTDADHGPLRVNTSAHTTASGTSLSLYLLSSSSALTSAISPIAEVSGGGVFPIGDSSQVGDAIIDAIDDSSAAPLAAIDSQDIVVAGERTNLTALQSHGVEPVSFHFDLDGDGIFETESAKGIISHTFPMPGATSVGLKVTDGQGRTSTTITNIMVVAPESIPGEGQGDTAGGSVSGSIGIASGSSGSLESFSLGSGR